MNCYSWQYYFIKQRQSASQLSWTTVKPVKRGWYFCKTREELNIVGFVSKNILFCYHVRNGFDNMIKVNTLVGEEWSWCVPQPEYNHKWFRELPTRARNVLLGSNLHVNRKILNEMNKDGKLRSVLLKVKNCGVATYGHIIKAIIRK